MLKRIVRRFYHVWHAALLAEPGELRSALPFFSLYACLFAGLTMADTVSLTLFVRQVPASVLPWYYGLTALLSFVLIHTYSRYAPEWASAKMFRRILLLSALAFALCYTLLLTEVMPSVASALLFVLRESVYTMVLLHFGTYLQDYFTKEQLGRLLPIIYAGGRVGGLLGAALLGQLVSAISVMHTIPFFVVAMVFGVVGVDRIHRKSQSGDEEENSESASACRPSIPPSAIISGTPRRGFIQDSIFILRQSPLVFWSSISGFLFMVCRWILVYQYSIAFQQGFLDAQSLARYLANYTQIALALSILVQLVLVGRLIRRIGLANSHMLYNLCMMTGFATGLFPHNLATATWCRFVESELRFSLRNPVNQLITNLYPRIIRIQARALTLGAVNPAATFVSSMSLSILGGLQALWIVPAAGLACGATYMLASWKMYQKMHDDLH